MKKLLGSVVLILCFGLAGFAQYDGGASEEDILVNLNADRLDRNVLEIRQVGELNDLQVTQTGRQRTFANQRGTDNEAVIELLGGQNNTVDLAQDGTGNVANFTLETGFNNEFTIRQNNDNNNIQSRLGFARDVEMEIVQNGENSVTIDVNNPTNLNGAMPSRIEQTSPNSPDVIISDNANFQPSGFLQSNRP